MSASLQIRSWLAAGIFGYYDVSDSRCPIEYSEFPTQDPVVGSECAAYVLKSTHLVSP